MAARAREFTRIAVVTVAVAILATVGTLAARQSGISRGESTAAQAWVLPALDGDGQVALADFRGKPLVVNFFASWCVACDIELPGFAPRLRGAEGPGAVRRRRLAGNRRPVRHAPPPSDHPVAAGDRHRWFEQERPAPRINLGDGRSMPITVFYDAQGTLLDTHIGLLPEPALRATIRQFYGDPPGTLTGSPTPLATFTGTPLRPRTPGG